MSNRRSFVLALTAGLLGAHLRAYGSEPPPSRVRTNLVTGFFKIGYFQKRKPGMSMEEFKEYYEKSHVPLACQCLAYSATEYSRKYLTARPVSFIERPNANSVVPESPYDVFAEVKFATRNAFEKAVAKPNDSKLELLRADEDKFLLRTDRRIYDVEEHVSPLSMVRRDHALHNPANATQKAQGKPALRSASLFKRKPGTSPEEFKAYYENHHVEMGYKYIVYNAHLYSRKYLKPLDSGPPWPYDVFMELEADSQEDLGRVMATLTPADRETIAIDEGKFMDRTDTGRLSFSVEQYTTSAEEIKRFAQARS